MLFRSWQVRNQARMHVWKGLPQHTSSSDSMLYWLETVTAVGVRMEADDSLSVIAPLGTDDLLNLRCQPKDGIRRSLHSDGMTFADIEPRKNGVQAAGEFGLSRHRRLLRGQLQQLALGRSAVGYRRLTAVREYVERSVRTDAHIADARVQLREQRLFFHYFVVDDF